MGKKSIAEKIRRGFGVTISKVVDSFVIMTKLTHEQALAYLPLCEAGVQTVYGMIGEWVDVERNEERLALAAAGIAFYSYSLAVQSGNLEGVNSFKLGELTVQQNEGSLEKAKSLRDEMLSYISDLLKQDAVVFKGV
ncbi:MAG: hypothetical protein RR205_01045 [Oscillospiraceae bacterium]